jgi:3-deoxy-D-manno-octulosonate 8-phosphate phosphatase (KDO 8-P phosphatase)
MDIELIVFSVDGTLTNGDIIVDDQGREFKRFNSKDILAITTWTKKFKKKVLLLSSVESNVVNILADRWGVHYVVQGDVDKLEAVREICFKESILMDNVAFLGYDLNDYKLLSQVGHSFAPTNAVPEITSLVKTVLKSKGGDGAGREMIEYICIFDDLKKDFLKELTN